MILALSEWIINVNISSSINGVVRKKKIMKLANTKMRRGISKLPRKARASLCIMMALLLCVPYLAWPPNKAEAAITVSGTSTTGVADNTTSMSINKPSNTIAGDVMLATFALSGTADITATGWTRITPNATGSDTTKCAATITTATNVQSFYKIAGSSEGSSYSFSWTGATYAAGGITTYKGVDNTSPLDTAMADTGYCNGYGGNDGQTMYGSDFSLNTTKNNSMVVTIYAQRTTSGVPNTISDAAVEPDYPAMTNRVQATSAAIINGVNTNQATVLQSDRLQATAGDVKPSRASSTLTGPWVSHMFMLRPAPAIEQSAYRFSVNADNNTPAYIANNLTAADDTARGTAFDPINSMFYTVGDNGSNWVIEKRRIADGALCTSTNCGTTFGTAGRITHDIPSSATEKAYDLDIDPGGGFIYIVGMDNAAGAGQWHIQKRDMMTGAIISSFDGDGMITANPSAGLDEALTLQLDTLSNYLYVGGYDNIGANDNAWSLRKYRTDNGAICTAANCGTLFGTAGTYTFDPSNKDDRISAIEIDPTNTYLYLAGFTTAPSGRTDWKMQKMLASSAALCTAANCVTQFGTAGTYTSDPTSRDDQILALQVDSAAGSIYISGFEQDTTNSTQWRIEKITLDSGALVTAFGGSGCTTNIAGAVCQKFTTNGNDKILSMELDGAGGYIYALGIKDEAGTNSEWRVQKRNRSDGSLVSVWATSGTATINPSVNKDPPSSIVIDVERGLLWAVGSDRTLGTSNMQWYFTQLQLDTGTLWLASQDTVAGASTSITFRLRMLLHVSEVDLSAGGQQFKLQFSPKVGTCDTSFVGENYEDIATGGSAEILYHDNPSIADAAAAVSLSGDPSHSGHTTVLQTIEESNNFTNTSNVASGQDGLWDFILKDNGAFGAYCFRALSSSNVLITSYTIVPEISFCKDDPQTTALLRHGTFFCEGQKKAFFWSL
jgi:hypothetical protein